MTATAPVEQVVVMLEDLLRRTKGRISPADASAATGLPLQDVKDGLGRLIELYECRVKLEESTGGVEFVFAWPMRLRGRKTLREVMRRVLATLWKAFRVFYQAIIGIMLLVYVVVFVVFLIAIALATSKNSDGDSPIGSIIEGLFKAIFMAIQFTVFAAPDYEFVRQQDGMSYKKNKPEENKGKGFVESVFSFVFGPPRPVLDPLGDAREVAAFLRRNNGRLTSADIVALCGADYDRADSLMAEYTGRFRGDLNIGSAGVVVGDFQQMLERGDPSLDGEIVYYKDEVDPPYSLTGNTDGRNALIICMNLFNLVMSFVGLGYFTVEYESLALAILLGVFPMVYSVLFFLIPLLRIPWTSALERRRERTVVRKKLVGAVVATAGRQVTLDELVWAGRVLQPEAPLAPGVMERLVLELRGCLDLSPDGRPVYTFPRLAMELGVGG